MWTAPIILLCESFKTNDRYGIITTGQLQGLRCQCGCPPLQVISLWYPHAFESGKRCQNRATNLVISPQHCFNKKDACARQFYYLTQVENSRSGGAAILIFVSWGAMLWFLTSCSSLSPKPNIFHRDEDYTTYRHNSNPTWKHGAAAW